MTNIAVNIHTGVAGAFRIHKGTTEDNMVPVTGWGDNHITNGGLNALGDPALSGSSASGYVHGCKIGSGNTPPTDTDTDLVSRLASSTAWLSRTWSRQIAEAPYYIEIVSRVRFAAGVGTGTIAELGIVYATSTSSGPGGAMYPAQPLFSRALCVDLAGNPTTVTKLADEIVDVEYRLRFYFDTTPITGTVTIGPSTYDYTLLPVRIEQNPGINQFGWGVYSLSVAGNGMPSIYHRQSGGYGENVVYTGAAAGVVSATGANPTGTKVTNSAPGNLITVSNAAYVSNSHEIEHIIKLQLGTANTGYNVPAGIGVFVYSNDLTSWQLGLTPNLVKTVDEEVSLSIFHTWGRYVP